MPLKDGPVPPARPELLSDYARQTSFASDSKLTNGLLELEARLSFLDWLEKVAPETMKVWRDQFINMKGKRL